MKISLPGAPRRVARQFAAVTCLLTGSLTGCSANERSAPPNAAEAGSNNAESQAVRAARAAQNRAISVRDTAMVASFWTEDVEIRRGLGALVLGDAYKRLFNPDSAAIASGEELIYQREPASVVVSASCPLAYEEGTWIGHDANRTLCREGV